MSFKKYTGANFILTERLREKNILEQARKRSEIIYGAQSIKKQIGGARARPTRDYDIFDRRSKEAVKLTEKNLDKLAHGNAYYTKPAIHKGTYKVKWVGQDGKKGTDDDVSVADYTTTPKPTPRFKVINGVRYRILKEEAAAKAREIKNPDKAYRHKKDQDDLNRIKRFWSR